MTRGKNNFSNKKKRGLKNPFDHVRFTPDRRLATTRTSKTMAITKRAQERLYRMEEIITVHTATKRERCLPDGILFSDEDKDQKRIRKKNENFPFLGFSFRSFFFDRSCSQTELLGVQVITKDLRNCEREIEKFLF